METCYVLDVTEAEKNALDAMKFNENYGSPVWEVSTIRQWLNEDFYNITPYYLLLISTPTLIHF